MNKALKLCIEDWIYFLGSDDYLYSNNVLEGIFSGGHPSYDIIYGNVQSLVQNKIYDGEFTYAKLWEKNICHQSIFFRKTVFEKAGNFNLRYQYCADWDHNLRCFNCKKIRISYINEIIAVYSDRGISTLNRDHIFLNLREWELLKRGSSATIYDKGRMLKVILSRVLKENGIVDLLKILQAVPSYLISKPHREHQGN